jgi:hypothetical protein
MLEQTADVVSVGIGVLAVGYVAYEINRRQRKLHDIWDILGENDEERTELLEAMVANGDLVPYTGGALP